jgi:hypothetical protein
MTKDQIAAIHEVRQRRSEAHFYRDAPLMQFYDQRYVDLTKVCDHKTSLGLRAGRNRCGICLRYFVA